MEMSLLTMKGLKLDLPLVLDKFSSSNLSTTFTEEFQADSGQ